MFNTNYKLKILFKNQCRNLNVKYKLDIRRKYTQYVF